jgi:hypothetical protein
MGAYGGTNQASKNGNLADFDVDGTVNFTDLDLFVNKWMFEGSCIEDLSNNGIVNFDDFCIFAENWLWKK